MGMGTGETFGRMVSPNNPVPVTISKERPYSIAKEGPNGMKGNDTIDLKAGVQKQVKLSGKSAYFRNTGNTVIYYDAQDGVDNRKTPLYPSGRVGPITDKDSLYFLCAVDTTLHYMFVEVMDNAT